MTSYCIFMRTWKADVVGHLFLLFLLNPANDSALLVSSPETAKRQLTPAVVLSAETTQHMSKFKTVATH